MMTDTQTTKEERMSSRTMTPETVEGNAMSPAPADTVNTRAARTPAIIDTEIARLHAQRPQLAQQVTDATRRCREIEARLGDLFVRSLCDETQQPQAETAALEQERQAAMSHAATLERALAQFNTHMRKLEEEKLAFIRQTKSRERDRLLVEQRMLARELDRFFEKSLMPQMTAFLARANTIHGLSCDIGSPSHATPKQVLARAVTTYFSVMLYPIFERPTVKVSFADIVPKQ